MSLHSDVRGEAKPWSPRPGLTCPRSDESPGFAVLFSDEAAAPVVAARRRLALALAARLAEAGFPPYDGTDYAPAYEAAPERPGVFLDRHPLTKRIFVLRTPSMPAVLLETHNALYSKEAERFREPQTLDAMDGAVTAAIVDVLSSPSEVSLGR